MNKVSIVLVVMLLSSCHGDSSEEGPSFSLRYGKYVFEFGFAKVVKPPVTINQDVCDRLCEVEDDPICVAGLYDLKFDDCHLYSASVVVGAFFVQNLAGRSSSDCSDCDETKAETCQKECAKNEECVTFSFDEDALNKPLCLLFNYDTTSLLFLNSSTAVFGIVKPTDELL